jgi:hypothetical protein
MAGVHAATVKASITTKSLITHFLHVQNAMRGGFPRVLRWSEKIWVALLMHQEGGLQLLVRPPITIGTVSARFFVHPFVALTLGLAGPSPVDQEPLSSFFRVLPITPAPASTAPGPAPAPAPQPIDPN